MSTTSQVGTPKHNTKRKMKTITHAWLITFLRTLTLYTYPNFTVSKAIIVRLASCVDVVFRTVFSGCTVQRFRVWWLHYSQNPKLSICPQFFYQVTLELTVIDFSFSKFFLEFAFRARKKNNNNNLNSSLSFEQARRTSSLSQLKGSLTNDEGNGYENVT